MIYIGTYSNATEKLNRIAFTFFSFIFFFEAFFLLFGKKKVLYNNQIFGKKLLHCAATLQFKALIMAAWGISLHMVAFSAPKENLLFFVELSHNGMKNISEVAFLFL